MRRRRFITLLGQSVFLAALPGCNLFNKEGRGQKPNIVLCMTDDQGWGDVGFHGHPVLKTPHLDEMAASGLQFERFYAAAPVCSPTRGSALTGRHPYRYGIFSANVGHMKAEEKTLAEILKVQGYATGHFGKWHLGTLTKKVPDSNRGGPESVAHYSPPWVNGFDVCFSTEAKVPTWDPIIKPKGQTDRRWWNPVQASEAAESYGTRYWMGPDASESENLNGNDSRVIMDRVIPFIRQSAHTRQPFFAVIWFHAPHWPVVAGLEYKELYTDQDTFAQNHFGCITAMDEQVGRLRSELKKLGVDENTMLWFCSDNGPEGTVADGPRHGKGSAGPLRGRKRSLYEGGIRVPGILEWPAKINKGRITQFPACTSDYYPTVLDALAIKPEKVPAPQDGISLLPLIENKMNQRSKRIGFQSHKQVALIDNRFKIISIDEGLTFELYDLINDSAESQDLASEYPEIVEEMKTELLAWKISCQESLAGNDYK